MKKSAAAATAIIGLLAIPALAQTPAPAPARPTPAKPPVLYTPAERTAAFQKLTQAPIILGDAVSVGPNAPYAADGTHLSFWKPSSVLATATGGIATVNVYGVHNEGHINIGFTPKPVKSYALDCRIVSDNAITYKIFAGKGGGAGGTGEVTLNADHHFLLLVPITAPGEAASVELWPTPIEAPMSFFGCDLSPVQ